MFNWFPIFLDQSFEGHKKHNCLFITVLGASEVAEKFVHIGTDPELISGWLKGFLGFCNAAWLERLNVLQNDYANVFISKTGADYYECVNVQNI